jgi:hypothetical protein
VEDCAFVESLSSLLSNSDVDFWATENSIDLKEAPNLFKKNCQQTLCGILRAKFNADVANLAIVRRSIAAIHARPSNVSANTPAAASGSASAAGAPGVSSHDASQILAKINELSETFAPLISSVPALMTLCEIVPKLQEMVQDDD